ncbi:hypothetical protein QFC22_005881 [Naganishia vaughanmartiniae]|uniref:Uncharacterized protein n=1 Tax=Naganishia vaughanmartiniae TaxID=1424756 RepID=A0ACC2WSH9_9TREE|nr:hypothetical protein QFC22_005881 [Naganishia vaughanmartiniae]
MSEAASPAGFNSLQMKYKVLRERHRMVVRRCMGAEGEVAVSNLVYDQLEVRLDEVTKKYRELEEKLSDKEKEIETIKKQSFEWCAGYMDKDKALQAQAKEHTLNVKAWGDKIKDQQEECLKLNAVVEIQRLKLEGFDETWQAVREATLKYRVASEKRFEDEAISKGKRKAVDEIGEEEGLVNRRDEKRAE